MKTIDISKSSNDFVFTINGESPRTLINFNNLTVKALENGVILKLTDESFRQEISMDDIVSTNGGDPDSPFDDVSALVTYINDIILPPV